MTHFIVVTNCKQTELSKVLALLKSKGFKCKNETVAADSINVVGLGEIEVTADLLAELKVQVEEQLRKGKYDAFPALRNADTTDADVMRIWGN